MAFQILNRSLVVLTLLALSVAPGLLTGPAMAAVAAQAQAKTLDRNLEPVVIKGSEVPALIGAPAAKLYVYTFNGNALVGNPIPAQVDEVTAGGSYVTSEDGVLDGNDEIVFMAKDLGDQPIDTAVLTGTLPIAPAWYEIEVIDPLSPGKKGWAYLVRRDTLTSISTDYVDYDHATKRIVTDPDRYELGIATSHVGLNYLALNGSGVNILDRTKVGTIFDVPLLGQVSLTENDLDNPEIIEIKDGPVRAIIQQRVTADSGGPIAEASLSTVDVAYASLLQLRGDISFTLTSSIELLHARISVDFNSAASGATFYNANIPGGVIINGSPDSVSATPLSSWAQVSHAAGRLVQVFDASDAGGTQKNYFCDDNTPGTTECDGTPNRGDNVTYGDAGVWIEGSVNPAFTFKSSLFILSPADGGQDNVGATHAEYYSQPLQAKAYLQANRRALFLPIILMNK
jgi:hypothetical protein